MMISPFPSTASAQPAMAKGWNLPVRAISREVTTVEGTVLSMIGSRATPVLIGDLPLTAWK